LLLVDHGKAGIVALQYLMMAKLLFLEEMKPLNYSN
jgi:hypothetical protein